MARWRADVSRYLSLHDAGSAIQAKFQPLVALAWTYLNTQGYINFGVAPALMVDPTLAQGQGGKASVVVIGAGMAGMRLGMYIGCF